MYSPDRHELVGLIGNGHNGNGNDAVIPDDLEIPRAVGCKECRGRGYKGRIGLFEVLFMTDELRSIALKHASTNEIRRLAVQLGMRGLREDGWRKIAAGWTTVDEVVRLTQEDEFDFGEVV
jgi:type II secretory ATPase GspE/PulE/Tfp pilus assembly ATPase PilB-like protein